jgi:hypothetical protein
MRSLGRLEIRAFAKRKRYFERAIFGRALLRSTVLRGGNAFYCQFRARFEMFGRMNFTCIGIF